MLVHSPHDQNHNTEFLVGDLIEVIDDGPNGTTKPNGTRAGDIGRIMFISYGGPGTPIIAIKPFRIGAGYTTKDFPSIAHDSFYLPGFEDQALWFYNSSSIKHIKHYSGEVPVGDTDDDIYDLLEEIPYENISMW